MSDYWQGLANSVQNFKKSVKEELEKENSDFHDAINGDEALRFYGLASNPVERNEYLVDTSDVLFWHDPIAYIDELERWQEQKIKDKYASCRDFIKRTDQTSVFSRFADALKRKRVCPFVGAGFSVANEYPLWAQALSQLINKLESVSLSEERAGQDSLTFLATAKDAFQRKDFLMAAQIIYDNQKIQFERFIMDKFDGANNKIPTGPILLLPEISDGCIVTTNFDGLIEKVFQDKHKPIEGYMHGTQKENQFAAKLIQGDRCILKLHGNYNSADTYIFSQEQYNDAYGENSFDYSKPLAKTLRQIFISHPLLFLGCSLEQDRTLELFADVYNSDTFNIPEHFAFLPTPATGKIDKENRLAQANIHPIWYDVKNNEGAQADHSLLDSLLDFAITCSRGKTRI